jgi:hypothetical protein
MWQCECGEFNNDEGSFCVACKKVRISEQSKDDIKKTVHATESMFRKIQEFILLDIALLALVAVVSFLIQGWSGLETDGKIYAYVLLFVVVILFQLFLLIGILRMFYNAAVNSERNSFFLQRIYELIKHEEEKDEESGSGPRPVL